MDHEWMERIRKREETALQAVIHTYGKLLYTVAATVLTVNTPQRQEEIEEVVQDVFFYLWQKPKKFDVRRGSLKNYLVMKTVSLAKNKIRKNKREFLKKQRLLEEQFLDTGTDLSLEVINIFEGIWQLDGVSREVIVHRFIYEEKPQEISQKLQLPIKEVNNRIYRGKQKIIQFMKGVYVDEE